MHDRITQLCNKRSEIYSDENEKLSDAKKHQLNHKCKHINLRFGDYGY